MVKRKKKTERQKLTDKLDDIIREMVRLRDKGICQKCGGQGSHVSHVVPRTNKGLRWDMDNVKLLCVRCHLYWWHKDVADAWTWFQAEFPYRADRIQSKRYKATHLTVAEMEALYDRLKMDYNKMQDK